MEVDDSTVKWIDANIDFPCLFFLDPCGYKGLSLSLIARVIRDFGCDCIFFFNYLRINQHLENPVMTANMNAFFGKQRAGKLREELKGKTISERQDLIISNLKDALVQHGGTYSIEYCFKKDDGNRTSHFLIFTTKHPSGFKKMAEIMGRYSSGKTEGVPSFSFDPQEKYKEIAPTLFSLHDSPIDKLAESLRQDFAGQTLTMQEVYYRHGLDNREKYILVNYRDALRKLEGQGKIRTNPTAEKRQIRDGIVTFGATVQITFPENN